MPSSSGRTTGMRRLALPSCRKSIWYLSPCLIRLPSLYHAICRERHTCVDKLALNKHGTIFCVSTTMCRHTPQTFLFYLGQWISRHLAMKSDTHTLKNSIIFYSDIKSWLDSFRFGNVNCHPFFAVFFKKLFQRSLYDSVFNFFNKPLFKGRNMEFLCRKKMTTC